MSDVMRRMELELDRRKALLDQAREALKLWEATRTVDNINASQQHDLQERAWLATVNALAQQAQEIERLNRESDCLRSMGKNQSDSIERLDKELAAMTAERDAAVQTANTGR